MASFRKLLFQILTNRFSISSLCFSFVVVFDIIHVQFSHRGSDNMSNLFCWVKIHVWFLCCISNTNETLDGYDTRENYGYQSNACFEIHINCDQFRLSFKTLPTWVGITNGLSSL